MKKIASIAIALMMVLSVSAADDINLAYAYNMNGTKSGSYTYGENDFNIQFMSDTTLVAYAELTCPSATSIAGTYHLGDGYTMFVGYLYDEKGTGYKMEHAELSMVCKGVEYKDLSKTLTNVPVYTFDVVCLNWYNTTTGANCMSFGGTIKLLAQNYSTSAVVTLTDANVNATEVTINTDPEFTLSGSYFEYEAYSSDGNYGIYLAALSDSIMTSATEGYYTEQGVYDVYNIYSVSAAKINGTQVDAADFEDLNATIVENADGTAFVASIYVKVSGQWYHMVGDYPAPATGIEEVKAAEVDGTAKTMENGQLVIIRNGVRYNAQGAVIK